MGHSTALFLAGFGLTVGVAAVAFALITRPARHLPAAPDNQPPTDTTDLWTCRRINALPTATRKED
ncbi:hypothetical protein [Streptomyces azureus]|uniref:Acriflavin resistance protein n=1 Tax=Streptomyces azureus TaxID=146537 RepID=A0A0K8PGB3_STRAJ|nr:hypothetical protein [Streptomyces azureus]GAP46925.1 acriflavin resistance protein [Streptomyces azureus]